MEAVRQYLVSVVAVCMITVPAILFVKKESLQKTVKLIGGVLILLVVIRPLLKIDFREISEQIGQFSKQYSLDSAQIEEDTKAQLAQCVKASAKKVIEQKGSELGGMLQAEVTVSGGDLPVPIHVKLTGSMSLDAVEKMQEFLNSAMDIPLDEQEWNLYGTAE